MTSSSIDFDYFYTESMSLLHCYNYWVGVSEHEDRRIASFRIRQYSFVLVSSRDIEGKWQERGCGQITASGIIVAWLCADRKGIREGIYGEVREGKSEHYRRVSNS